MKTYLLATTALHAPDDGRGADQRPRVNAAIVDDNEPDAVGDEPAEDNEDLVDPESDEDPVDPDEDLVDPDEDPEPEPEPRQRSRGQRRIETLSTRNRELEQQIADSQARLAALEARQSQPNQHELLQQQRDEDARIALMSPEERMEYRLRRTLEQQQQQVNGTLASIQDQTDRTEFRNLLRERPQFKVHEAAVEKEFKRLHSLRTPMTREAILMFIIGQQAVQAKGKPQPKARSQQRMREQEAQPVSARGDVRGDRRSAGSTASARERRLSNIRI